MEMERLISHIEMTIIYTMTCHSRVDRASEELTQASGIWTVIHSDYGLILWCRVPFVSGWSEGRQARVSSSDRSQIHIRAVPRRLRDSSITLTEDIGISPTSTTTL